LNAFGVPITLVVLTRAIIRPPAPNFAEGLTTVDLGAPNYECALTQHEAYCLALEQCGLTLTRLEPDQRYPDSCFVEDTAILTEALLHGRATAPARGSNRCAVLTRPGAPSRTGEIASIKKVLNGFYPNILSIQPPGTVDGGDVCEAGDHFFIGISERTNEDGAQQLAELVAPFGYTSSFVDISKSGTGVPPVTHAQDARATHMLHLKSGLAWLGDNRLVVIDALANRAEFSKYDLVRVETGEEYAANCVRVNDHVLVAAGYPVLEGKLRELGYQTSALDMTEFQKMDGGLSCLSLRF
jgi:dimethylargininase